MLMNNDEVLLTILENIQEKINDITTIMEQILIEEINENFEEKIMYLYKTQDELKVLRKVLEDLEKNILDDEEKEMILTEDACIMWEQMLDEYEKAKKKKKKNKKKSKKDKKQKKTKKEKKEKKEKDVKKEEINKKEIEDKAETAKIEEIEEVKVPKGVKKIGDLWIL